MNVHSIPGKPNLTRAISEITSKGFHLLEARHEQFVEN